MNGSDEYYNAYEAFFDSYNMLESTDHLKEKAYGIAKGLYDGAVDGKYAKAATAFAMLKALRKIGFPYKLTQKDNLIKTDIDGLVELEMPPKDVPKRKKITTEFLDKSDVPPKRIVYPKKSKLDFEKGDVLARKTKKGDYLCAACLAGGFPSAIKKNL
jgi:hypothetical protein